MVSFTLSSAFVSLLMVASTLGYQLVDDNVVKRQEEPTSFHQQPNLTVTTTVFYPQVTTLSVVTPEAGEPSAIVTNYTTVGVVSIIGPPNGSIPMSTYSEPSDNYTFSAMPTNYTRLNSTSSYSSNLANQTDIASPPGDSGNSAAGFSRPRSAIAVLGLMVSAIAFL